MGALSADDMVENAKTLAKKLKQNFLELGKLLRQLKDKAPELFQKEKVLESPDLP